MKIIRSEIICLLLFSGILFAQEDSVMTQKQWETLRDTFAVDAIILLAKMDTLSLEIDSLKMVLDYTEKFDCDEELYKLVGATKEQVSDFRNKFGFTENRIRDKSGSPGEARVTYFNEIKYSRIRCLPEFSERFLAMVNGLEVWENSVQTAYMRDSLYTVVEGDYLKRIAADVYGSSKYWELILDANSESIYNADSFAEKYKKRISNPDRIYPGQILRIPALPNE